MRVPFVRLSWLYRDGLLWVRHGFAVLVPSGGLLVYIPSTGYRKGSLKIPNHVVCVDIAFCFRFYLTRVVCRMAFYDS